MTLFDWAVIAVIAISTLMAAAQGFLLEAISLVGLVVGLWLAFWNYHLLAVPLARHISSEHVADALAFLLIAAGVMIVANLIGRLSSRAARTIGLGGLDHLLGAIFGAVRGYVLVLAAIIAIVAFMPQKAWLSHSRLAPYFLSAAQHSSVGAPEALRFKIQQGVADIEHLRPSWIDLGLHPPPETR